MIFPDTVTAAVKRHEFPLLFATVSGAHLYGFPSPDSDYDLRGSHILPIENVIGLDQPTETISFSYVEDGVELDLVTHDIKKFFLLMLRKNGYVLEQLLSPLIVQSSDEHQELKAIGMQCITRHHSHHYLGFADTQWKMFEKEMPPRVKTLLYAYRVLLTGINLMDSGVIEANLVVLNERFKLSYIPELVQRKLEGGEKQKLTQPDLNFHRNEFNRLRAELQRAFEISKLPDLPSGKPALDDLLTRLRLQNRLISRTS